MQRAVLPSDERRDLLRLESRAVRLPHGRAMPGPCRAVAPARLQRVSQSSNLHRARQHRRACADDARLAVGWHDCSQCSAGLDCPSDHLADGVNQAHKLKGYLKQTAGIPLGAG